MRTRLVTSLLVLAFLTGCPDRKEAIEQVGGAPKAAVDEARVRIDKAEAKLQGNADAAAAASE